MLISHLWEILPLSGFAVFKGCVLLGRLILCTARTRVADMSNSGSHRKEKGGKRSTPSSSSDEDEDSRRWRGFWCDYDENTAAVLI